MKHVLWIGGPPGAGKTTIATMLARRHGLRLYSADTRTWAHRDRALNDNNPAARQWELLTPAERWDGRTPQELFEMSLHRERGPMTIDDLRALPTSPLIVAEGSTLPASALSSAVAERSRAVWLLPTPEFQSHQLAKAGTGRGQTALYLFLREVVEREAHAHDVPTLTVDGTRDIAEMVSVVEQLFGGALAAGPRATSLPERQSLLRAINDAIIEQVRGYHARPWADGDAESVTRVFVCECGALNCDADVRLRVGEAAADRVLAPRHGAR